MQYRATIQPTKLITASGMSIKFSRNIFKEEMFPKGFLAGSPQTVLVTKEGLSMNMSTFILKMFSIHLNDLLSLPPCVSTSIILPDFSHHTVSNLIEILTKGYSEPSPEVLEREEIMQNVLQLAEGMGIDMKTLFYGNGESEVVPTKESSINRSKRLSMSIKNILGNDNSNQSNEPEVTNYTSENTLDSSVSVVNKNEYLECKVCRQQLLTIPLLGYHYCSHFLTELQDLKMAGSVKDDECSNCDRKFYDNRTLLAHVGVKHEFINKVLQTKGFPTLDFSPHRHQINENTKSVVLKNVSIVTSESKRITKKVGPYVKIEKLQHVTMEQHTEEEENKEEDFMKKSENMIKIRKDFDISSLHDENTCLVCGKSFEKERLVRFHIAKYHVPQDDKEKINMKFPSNESPVVKRIPKRDGRRSGVKVIRKCQMCDKSFETQSIMVQHMVVKHFFRDIKKASADLYQGSKCLVCDKNYATEMNMMLHIGSTHRKVNEFLLQKGLKPIPSPRTGPVSEEENYKAKQAEKESNLEPKKEVIESGEQSNMGNAVNNEMESMDHLNESGDGKANSSYSISVTDSESCHLFDVQIDKDLAVNDDVSIDELVSKYSSK